MRGHVRLGAPWEFQQPCLHSAGLDFYFRHSCFRGNDGAGEDTPLVDGYGSAGAAGLLVDEEGGLVAPVDRFQLGVEALAS